MEKEMKFETMDLYLSAFLSLSGQPPRLKINHGKVIFSFPASNDIYKLMTNFNSNVNVPVTDFVTTVKTLRGQMLSMRKTGK